jgi:hypothetical protein
VWKAASAKLRGGGERYILIAVVPRKKLMDANSPQPAPLPPNARKYYKLGMSSFILAIVALPLTCLYLLNWRGVINIQDQTAVNLIVLLMELAGLAALVGIGLGIAAVVHKGTNKVFGILGLVFNSLILLAACPLGITVVLYALTIFLR